MLAVALSLMILASLALTAGAIALWRRGERQRPGLMAVLVLILLVNVGIWTLPDASGEAPTQKAIG